MIARVAKGMEVQAFFARPGDRLTVFCSLSVTGRWLAFYRAGDGITHHLLAASRPAALRAFKARTEAASQEGWVLTKVQARDPRAFSREWTVLSDILVG